MTEPQSETKNNDARREMVAAILREIAEHDNVNKLQTND